MRQVKLKNIIFGNDKITIQSMTNIKTSKVTEVIEQISKLIEVGVDIVRLAILDMDDAKAIKEIKKQINIPLVADIHFDYKLALESIDSGIDKIRFNPANINDPSKIKEIVLKCKEKNIPIRIGINAGSFLDRDNLEEQMINAAKENVKLLEELDFYDIVISFKSSDINTTLKVNRLASKMFDYPLHIGLTEAGTLLNATIKNTYVISTLLNENIGSTIRVSMTTDPVNEVLAAKEILKTLDKYSGPTLISCPTCGRTPADLEKYANEVQKYLDKINKNIKVAVMGCVVNGPGEAKDADLGIALGKFDALLFKKGEIIKKVSFDDVVKSIIYEIDNIDKN